jgi:hypothetical protein
MESSAILRYLESVRSRLRARIELASSGSIKVVAEDETDWSTVQRYAWDGGLDARAMVAQAAMRAVDRILKTPGQVDDYRGKIEDVLCRRKFKAASIQ